jgi:predicted permease
MKILAYLRSLISSLFHRKQFDQDLEEEVRTHIDRHADDLERSGVSRPQAERQARIAFGAMEKAKENVREQRAGFFLETLWKDARFGLRMLFKNPGFTTVAILTLALGIGANAAIFELLDAVRLRTLPVVAPQELAEVRIAGGNHGFGLNQDYGELTRPLWQEVHDRQQSFSGTFAWSVSHRYTGRGAEQRPFKGLWVTGNFFSVLGVQPWRGRLIQQEDETSCPATHVVVSYGYWKNVLGGRDINEGIQFVANNDLVQVVGVTPPKFFGMVVGDNFDIAFPFCNPKDGLARDIFDVSVMGRLKPGISLDRASSELAVLSPGIFEATVPPGRSTQAVDMYKNFRLAVYPADTGVSGLRQYNRSLWLLLGITGLVLLIACANLANLMLARATSRQTEIAVRLALGASRGRVVRQLFMESILLAATGAVLGIALAQFLGRILIWQISTQNNLVNLQMATDWRVLLFVAAVAALTCILFGTAPALRATRTQPIDAMKSGGRSTAGREHLSLQQLLVVAQISVSMVLLVGALLFVHSFRNLLNFDPGVREAGVTAAFFGFWQANMPPERWTPYRNELLAEVQSVPGVISAAGTTNVPLSGQSWEHNVEVDGAESSASKFAWVSPDYFPTMGIPVTKGRGFTKQDTATSAHVAIVNDTFVRRFFHGANPLGKTMRSIAEPGYPSTVFEIVGVIPDTRYQNLRVEAPPMAFVPLDQNPAPGPFAQLLIYSSSPPPVISSAIKQRLAAKYPEVLAEFYDYQKAIRDGLIEERLMATLSGFFGLLAALLTMIGVYGVISYMVSTRRNEIGIRVALGASRWNVASLVLRQTFLALAFGVVIGVILALLLTRGTSAILFGLQPNDPFVFVAATALLVVIALLGSVLPARRAASVDPIAALRYE